MQGPRTIDVNSDVGESYGAFQQGADDELFPLISSANVACGFHGGDPRTMERTVRTLAHLGVAIGAHPSFPDIVGFGRRVIDVSPDEIRTDVIYQVGALMGFCHVVGIPLHHVKPHGALYNLATKDHEIAGAIVEAVSSLTSEVAIYAQPGSALEMTAMKAGLRVMREAFADRAYLADGTLAPRSGDGSVLTDPEMVGERVIRIIQGEPILTLDGQSVVIAADTVCIHSDTPTAVPIAKAIRRMLAEAKIDVQASR